MAEDFVDIQKAATTVSKENLLPSFFGNPEDIAKQFGWKKEEVIAMQKTEQQMIEFQKEHPEIKFDIQKTLFALAKSTKDASDAFDLIYQNQAERPGYHNGDHTTITATIGLKILLGGLVELYEDPDFRAEMEANPEKTQQLIDIGIESMARHEQEEWWSRRSEEAIAKLPEDPVWDENQRKAKESLLTRIQELGVSPEDFNRLNMLDTFYIPLESTSEKTGTLDMAMGPEPLKNPYFTDTDGKPDFTWISKNVDIQRKYLRLLGTATRTADFLQLYNPNYYRLAILHDPSLGLTDVISNTGSVALAIEFKKFRPGAAKPIGWLNDEGEVNWINVGVGKKYLVDYALPNIRPGVDYLKNFNPTEGNNVDIITTHLEKTVGIKN